MASLGKYVQAAFGALLLSSMAMGQTAYPDFVVQDESWHTGQHHYSVTQKILSPGVPAHPVSIVGTADAEFVSGTSVHLTDGFHAGGFSGSGHFHAYIDQGLGAPGDVVVINPDPATNITGSILHVNKWEELEVGVQLPQEYRDAIDSFFTHYYANGTVNAATPANVDIAHDLNPYADDSLQVVMTLTSPSNMQTLKWGFFMREAGWASSSPAALLSEAAQDPLHPYTIRFRMAPDEEGPWQFNLAIQAPQTIAADAQTLPTLLFNGYSFVCDAPLPDNHGPLRVNATNHRTLQFEDGTAFFGLGTNMADRRIATAGVNTFCKRDLFYMQKTMEQLHDVGGNFMRMFLMPNIFAPEFVNLGVYDAFRSPDPCSIPSSTPTVWGNCQYQCWAFDQMLDSARVNNIQIQLCVDPYPPIIAFENFIWGNHAYMINFIEPHPQAAPLNKYDLKRFFFNDGDPSNTGSGVFYYWKRKYKYIMSRWGYSVNIAAIEPFNEVDQMLSYRTDTINSICDENDGIWAEDPALPGTYNNWLTAIISYVKGPQHLTDPQTSPLGESKKLFLAGTGPEDYDNPNWSQPTNPNWNLPNRNPNVDLVDVHNGLYWGEGELSGGFDKSRLIRDAYTSNSDGTKRPFHQGESNYYQLVDINPIDTITDYYDAAKIFDNYDVSFHNELWSSTFFGNFAAATTWHWERVFWWPNALPTPPPESPTQNPDGYIHTNVLNAWNTLNPNYVQVQVQNRPVYHNFKPLSDFLANPNLQAYGLFDDEFHPHKHYDEANKIEAYYLTNADSTLAIGWVHNLNAYWQKHYYVKNDPEMQNFFGCTEPGMQLVSLGGLQPGVDYHITWFPTRMNDTIHPADVVDTTRSGSVLLDFSPAQMGDTAQLYLDTLHLDYAFIIALQPVHRNMQVSVGDGGPDGKSSDWNFSLYPNPARNEVNVVLPNDEPVDVALYDLLGRRVRGWKQMKGPQILLRLDRLSQGAYYLRVSAGEHSQVKPIIIH